MSAASAKKADSYRTAEDVDEAERALAEVRRERDRALVANLVSALSLADLLAGGVRFTPSWVADYKANRDRAAELDREVFSKMNTLKRTEQKYHRAGADGVLDDEE